MKIAAALAGATGLVGGHVLRRLLDDPMIERVVAPTRRALPPHPKLENPLIGAAFPALSGIDEAYGCLGTTRKDAGSAAAFRAVDFDLTVAFARAAKAGGARRFGLVSTLGANAGASLLYPRTKGEAEAAVAGLGFETLVIARPSLLLGERAKPRVAEKIGEAALAMAGPFLAGPWRKYRAIPAETVAEALISKTRSGPRGTHTLESDALEAH